VISIGTFLKKTRENLSLQLQDVQTITEIDVSVLSRIENDKRFPTKSQMLQLSQLYKCNKEKVIINWFNEKIISEESFLHEKHYSVFPELEIERKIELESRRYIGNKAKLTKWIIDTILSETENVNSFIDVFAGTASVVKLASQYFPKITINDILYSNNVIYKAFFKNDFWNKEKVQNIVDYYNIINARKLEENYFSKNYGDKFFDKQNAKLIGYIREDIEKRKQNLTEKEYSILLASLIYNIDKIANTVGHFDAYIKKPIKCKKLIFRLINPVEIENVSIYQENANLLVRKTSADIAYIDPPYNSRQYSRFYHVYENLVKWKKPPLFGVALKPEPENMSVYCTAKASEAFRDLIKNLNVKYIAVSYNNTYYSKSSSSENKIKLETIENILNKKGKTKIFESSYRFFNTGKTEFNNHKELLFITKVDNE